MGVSICLDLDVVKEWVSTVEKISTASKSKSWQSRSRLLDFVSTSMSIPKSLDRDQEIRRYLKISAFLDSLSRSRSRSAWIFVFSRRDFSIRRDFSSFSDSKGLDNVKISWQISTASRQISKTSTRLDKSWQSRLRLDNLDKNLNASKSRLKNLNFKNLDREKKKLISTVEKISTIQKKLVSTRRTISISIGLDCRDPHAYFYRLPTYKVLGPHKCAPDKIHELSSSIL